MNVIYSLLLPVEGLKKMAASCKRKVRPILFTFLYKETTMSTYYAGLDAHSTISTVVVIDEAGEKVDVREDFPTCKRALLDALDQDADHLQVHLEASSIHRDIHDLIHNHVEEVVVSDPRQNALVENTGGGDRIEAHQLARLLRLGAYSRVYLEPDDRKRRFRKVVMEYIRLNEKQAKLKQSTQMFMQEEGLQRTGSTRLSTRENRRRILDRVDNSVITSMLKERFDELEMLLEKRGIAEERMHEHAKPFPVIQRYDAMPGGGIYTGSVFVAIIRNPFRFQYRQQVWKYATLAVKTKESAGKKKKGDHLNRAGHGHLKDVLYTIFMAAQRRNDQNGFKRFYRASLSETGDQTRARLNTMRKICDVMWSMWKHSTEYDDDRVRHPNGS